MISRLFFRREEQWRQRQNARLMTGVAVISLLLGTAALKIITILYHHTK